MAVSSFANPQTLNNDLTLTFGLVGALSTAVSIATVVIAVHRYMQSRGTTAERSDDVEMQRHSVDSSDGGHDRNEDEPNGEGDSDFLVWENLVQLTFST